MSNNCDSESVANVKTSSETTASTLSALANSFMPAAATINNNNNNNSNSTTIPPSSIPDTILHHLNSDSFNNFITYAAYNPLSSLSSTSSSSCSSSSSSTSSEHGFNNNCSSTNYMVPYFNQVMTPLPPLFDEPKTNHLTNLQISNLFANAAPTLPPLASSTSSSSSQKRTKLFVGNLSSDTTLAELVALFSRFGVVNEKLCVVKDDNYAFIHFFSERSADDACQNLNDSFFKNRYIRVQYSTSQGHIKKTTTTAATTMMTNGLRYGLNSGRNQLNEQMSQMARSSSAMLLNEAILARYFATTTTTKRLPSATSSCCLSEEQLKSSLLVPASYLKSLESSECALKRHPLTSSQSVQSFGSVGAGRPILKAKYV